MLLPSFWTVRLEQPISKLGVRVIESTMATSTYFNSLSSSVVFYCYPKRKMKGPWTVYMKMYYILPTGKFLMPKSLYYDTKARYRGSSYKMQKSDILMRVVVLNKELQY